jgi:hypothetical protein
LSCGREQPSGAAEESSSSAPAAAAAAAAAAQLSSAQHHVNSTNSIAIQQMLIYIVLLLFIASLAFIQCFASWQCSSSGSCQYCSAAELDEDYCEKTQRKELYFCITGVNITMNEWRECTTITQPNQLLQGGFILLELCLFLLSFLSYYYLKKRRSIVLQLHNRRLERMINS